MTTQARVPILPNDSVSGTAEKRAALQAVLNSRIFQGRPRLASLLHYICERYFEGEIEAIKEYSIATEVFGRPPSFDQATDSIVRVEVFRLRKRLREFYESEGADQPLEIVIAPGHYRPEFTGRTPFAQTSILESSSSSNVFHPFSVNGQYAEESANSDRSNGARPHWQELRTTPPERGNRRRISRLMVALTVAALMISLGLGLAAWRFNWLRYFTQRETVQQPTLDNAAVLPAGAEIRIRCGYTRALFKDDEGNIWLGDRYYSGGSVVELPNQSIARTRNPELYLTARTGVFSYRIPLKQGTYELRLHFAETTYSPASTLGGGENSRVFDIRMNGWPLLTQFDIVSDAGANTADIRVFRDVSPDKDGSLHLDFNGSLGLPMINAIEIIPSLPHRVRPIRMVTQNSFFVDTTGNLWMPDSYYSSGRLAEDKVSVKGTPEPGLFAGERYGNFTYALPVDQGSYKMTLYFSEKYWGVSAAQNQPAGRRVFDVFCNGTALMRGFDIAQEAGPARALVKVFHGLQPNAQGKLLVSFVPEINYASVDAVEVEQERP
jgi:Malectin domain